MDLDLFLGNGHLKPFARDGIPVCWINQDRPKSKHYQHLILDTRVYEQVWSKVGKVKERGYLQSGYVKS